MFLTTRNYSRESGPALPTLTDRIQRLVNETLGPFDWQYRDNAGAAWVPAVDVFEEADKIRITAEIPGVKPEDIDISLEGNLLTIHGTKQHDAEQRTERVHRYERTYGAFERSFTLPASVDPQTITANYDHGVLTLTLPKSEKARPRQIQIEVTGRQKEDQSGTGTQWSPAQERATSRRSEPEKQSR